MSVIGPLRYNLLDKRPDAGQTWEFYTMEASTKFFSLFSYGKHHLTMMEGRVIHNHEGYNSYTAEVIEMMAKLADYCAVKTNFCNHAS